MKPPSAEVLEFGSRYNLPRRLRRYWDEEPDALRRFNETLFRRYLAGQLDRPQLIIDPSEGCGAGEIDVEFVARSPLREFYLIPEFFYSVCLEQGRNVWSSTDCQYTTRGTRAFAAGVWRYRAVFEDGSVFVERVDFGRELVDIDGKYWIPQ